MAECKTDCNIKEMRGGWEQRGDIVRWTHTAAWYTQRHRALNTYRTVVHSVTSCTEHIPQHGIFSDIVHWTHTAPWYTQRHHALNTYCIVVHSATSCTKHIPHRGTISYCCKWIHNQGNYSNPSPSSYISSLTTANYKLICTKNLRSNRNWHKKTSVATVLGSTKGDDT
jgi:hypothetical protein